MTITEKMTESFQDKHGRVVGIRPLQNTDAPLLVSVFEHMSSNSRYSRFQTPIDNPNMLRVWEEAERIARLSPESQFGLVAFMDLPEEGDNVPVGVARYVLVEPGVAEVAMSVRDDMHGSGIGSALFLRLVERAAAHGLDKLVASIQNSNEAMWRLVEKQPYPVRRMVDGNSSEIEIGLDPFEL